MPANRRVQLAEALIQRRGSLGYKDRADFVRRAPGSPSYSLIATVESSGDWTRSNFNPQTLARLDEVYRLVPGSIADFMAGKIADIAPLPTDDAEVAAALAARGIRASDLAAVARVLSALGDLTRAAG